MAEYPYMPLFVDAYLADTTHLSTTEHGAYMLLLMAAWRRPGCDLPDDDVKLAKIAKQPLTNWLRRIRPALAEFFQIGDGVWRQKRQAKERAHIAAVTEKRRDAARVRHADKPLKPNGAAPANAPPHAGANADKPTPTEEETESYPTKQSLSRSTENPIAPAVPASPAAPASVSPARLSLRDLPRKPKRGEYHPAFEAAWQAYPTRQEDTKAGCYQHWRKAVGEDHADPSLIIDAAHEWADKQADNDLRFGMLRWLREGLFNEPAPVPRAATSGGGYVASHNRVMAMFHQEQERKRQAQLEYLQVEGQA